MKSSEPGSENRENISGREGRTAKAQRHGGGQSVRNVRRSTEYPARGVDA